MSANGSMREKAVLAIAAVTVVYAATLAFGLWRGRESWDQARAKYLKLRARCEREAAEIARGGEWDAAYDGEVAKIPRLDAGAGSDTAWMGMVDGIAKENAVFITERRPGKEEEVGDLLSQTVEIRWSAALSSLVKFLYDLENSEDGKFDVQAINFSPDRRPGYLTGSMTLTCIYLRN